MDNDRYRRAFVSESLEHVDTLEQALLTLRGGTADTECINAAFRAVHSIKGSCSTFGLSHLGEFSHDVENTLDRLRAGDIEPSDALADHLLDAVDCLRELLALAEQSRDEAVPACEDVLERIRATTRKVVNESKEATRDLWSIRVTPEFDVMSTMEPLWVIRGLSAVGELKARCDVERLPTLAELDLDGCYLSWDIELVGATDEQVQDGLMWFEGVAAVDVEHLGLVAGAPASEAKQNAGPKAPSRGGAPKSAAKMRQRNQHSIRVDVEKVDRLMNMLGELVIGQAMLKELITHFTAAKLPTLHSAIERLETDTRALQDAVMQVRMLPASMMLQRLPRVVDDLCRTLEKEVDLVIEGERTEIDKRVLEELGDPMMHMIRNSLDHGIEAPDERERLGKPRCGTLRVSTFHRGGFVYVEIADDGAGLNGERILASAKSKGLVPGDATLETHDACTLIFMPGLSTAAEVTDVSGRGVGMDVVRRNIEALGGSVSARSEPGKGCVFVIRLPLTLAIVDGQLARVGDEVYVIPVLSIVESVRRNDELVRTLPGGERVMQFRDGDVRVVELSDVFAVPRREHEKRGLLVVVEGDRGPLALSVDELLGQQQVVLKSLKENYGSVPGVSAATILGDGRVSMIVDVHGIAQLAREGMMHHATSRRAATLH